MEDFCEVEIELRCGEGTSMNMRFLWSFVG